MSAPETTDSPQLKLFEEWRQGCIKDPNSLARILHKDFRKVRYPRSLGKPEQNKEEWIEEKRKMTSFLTEPLEPIVRSVIVDTPGKIVLHVTGRAKTSIGVDMERESIVIAHIVTDEDGNLKFSRVEEFSDSKTDVEFLKALEAAKSRQQQGSWGA